MLCALKKDEECKTDTITCSFACTLSCFMNLAPALYNDRDSLNSGRRFRDLELTLKEVIWCYVSHLLYLLFVFGNAASCILLQKNFF